MPSLVPKDAPLAARAPTEELLSAFQEFMRLDVAQGDASPETVRSYWSQVRAFVTWCEGEDIKPSLATEEDLKAYRADMISQGLARATIASRLNVVRRFYDMAQARGYRLDNPAKSLKAPKDLKDRTGRVKWLPLAAIHRILEAPDESTLKGKRDRAILALMAIHGLRRIEVARLRLGDLNFQSMIVTVQGKGGKKRKIPLLQETVVILQEWLEVRPGAAAEGEEALFVTTRDGGNGGPGYGMSRRSVNKIVDGYLDDLGLKREGLSCHALRHSYATLSLAAGARLDVISRTLGHASVTTTQVYADIVDMAAENPAKFLIGALEGIQTQDRKEREDDNDQ